jgi:hypothetical protein
MIVVIKVFINNEPVGYLDAENWCITKKQSEAYIYDLDIIVLKEVTRQASRFCDIHDFDDNSWMECRIIEWKINEYSLEQNEKETIDKI